MILFREAQPSAFFVIFITAIWPVILNTAVGIRNLDNSDFHGFESYLTAPAALVAEARRARPGLRARTAVADRSDPSGTMTFS